jgi:hypothetical protein
MSSLPSLISSLPLSSPLSSSFFPSLSLSYSLSLPFLPSLSHHLTFDVLASAFYLFSP